MQIHDPNILSLNVKMKKVAVAIPFVSGYYIQINNGPMNFQPKLSMHGVLRFAADFQLFLVCKPLIGSTGLRNKRQ